VTVPGPANPLGLTLTTSSTSTQHKVTLNWTRAQGSTVYIYRDGLVLRSTSNDGKDNVSKSATGAATYIFKVCEAATTICSNPATAQFGAGAPTTNALPNAAFTPGCTPAGCRFSDGSTDPDGSVTAWLWDFGDGSSSNQRNPLHTFASAGTYQVRLTVTDDRGGQGATTRQVTVGEPTNAPPAADLGWSCTALDCMFTDGSADGDGGITAWLWDFGDGETASEQNPSHSYGAANTYTVSLTVTDDDGAQSSVSKQVTVSLPGSNASPVADFTSDCTNLTCGFTDRSTDPDGSVVSWSWTFGDGATSTAQNPSRTYAATGSYDVVLTVTDDDGATQQHSATVSVTAPPPPASISLTVSGWTEPGKHFIKYFWSGASGSSVDLYRNGQRVKTTENDGKHTTVHQFTGTATWRVKACQAGSTTVCSPERSITLNN
jgi:PKD repeat protein